MMLLYNKNKIRPFPKKTLPKASFSPTLGMGGFLFERKEVSI